jgi:predicted  nucleic acid-binding Zn ribbon protein
MADESKVQRVARQTVKKAPPRFCCPKCKIGTMRWTLHSPLWQHGKMQFMCDNCDFVEDRDA